MRVIQMSFVPEGRAVVPAVSCQPLIAEFRGRDSWWKQLTLGKAFLRVGLRRFSPCQYQSTNAPYLSSYNYSQKDKRAKPGNIATTWLIILRGGGKLDNGY